VNNTFVIIAISATFVVGAISANPIVEAAGGWKAITEFLQGEIDKNTEDIASFNEILNQVQIDISSLSSSVTLSSLECIANQVALYDGTNWQCLTISVPPPFFESVEVFGYDATDGNSTRFHDGIVGNFTSGGTGSDGLLQGEYIAVYLKNDSVTKITMNEVRFAGSVFQYEDQQGGNVPNALAGTTLDPLIYTIVLSADDGNSKVSGIDSIAPEMEPGQHVTVLLSLADDMLVGQDFQFLMTTTNGRIVVGMINMGSQSEL